MADQESSINACAVCGKTESDRSVKLKRCAKCQTTIYCSRECQKVDWKQHKKRCTTNAAAAAAADANSSNSSDPAAINKPFHRLEARTWLHRRSEKLTYQLLIDAYRLRMEDDSNMGDIDEDSIYNDEPDGRKGFRRFLRKAESRANLLPPWWTAEKKAACEAMGLTGGDDGWSNLRNMVDKHGVIKHYGGNNLMPMQLRMFAEQVIGTGPGGQSGEPMRMLQMAIEQGEVEEV